MHVSGVGTFSFSTDGGDVQVAPEEGVDWARVADVYWRSVAPMVLQTRGIQSLHASGVLLPCGVIALCGISGTGKSTLAWALGERGRPLWADDVVTFECDADRDVVTRHVPFATKLRPAAAALLAGDAPRSEPDSHPQIDVAASRLAGVVILEQIRETEGRDAVALDRLSRLDALPAVLAHAYAFTTDDPHIKRRMINQYAQLVDQVPVFTCRFTTGLHNLHSTVDALQSTLTALCKAA